MRCPECNQRNSVAANVCSSCEYKFPARPIPYQAKVLGGFVAAVVVLWFVASALLPFFMDSKVMLANAAQALAKGSASPQDFDHLFNDFDKALGKYLDQKGKTSSRDIASELEKLLPSALFEPHVFDLCPGLKLVEVDAGLQVSDYLVLTEGSSSKVVPVPNLGVFDDSSIISDAGNSNLVLLGHLSQQLTHVPSIKVFNILPGDLIDATIKAQPLTLVRGTAKFQSNKRDIQTAMSLNGLAQAEHLFRPDAASGSVMPDETVGCSLVWSNGHYLEQWQTTKGPLFVAYSVVKSLQDPAQSGRYVLNLSKKAHLAFAKLAQSKSIGPNPDFTLHASGGEQPGSHGAKIKVVHVNVTNAQSSLNMALVKTTPGPSNRGVWIVDSLDSSKGSNAAPTETVATKPGDTTEPTPAEAPKTVNEAETAKAIASATTRSATTIEPPITNEKPKVKEPETVAEPTEKPEPKEVAETPKEPEEAPAGASSGVSSGTVTIRKGPGITFASLTTVPKGSTLTILGRKNSWYHVRAAGKEGFVYAGLVDSSNNAYKTATVKLKHAITDASHRSVDTVQPGERLVVLATAKNDKYKVQLANGKIGYVAKDAVEDNAPVSANASSSGTSPSEPPQFVP